MDVPGSGLGGRQTVILCYGSSTTWGYDPKSGARFPENTRWPCVMRDQLGEGFVIIEEGLNGRTVLDHIPSIHPANGFQYLDSLLDNVGFDFIVIYLGINDLFADREVPVRHVAGGMEKMIHRVKFKRPGAVIIIVSPPKINGDFEAAYLYQSEIEKSGKFSHEYKHIAAANACLFVDADRITVSSPIDGVHMEEAGHLRFGAYMADFIRLSI